MQKLVIEIDLDHIEGNTAMLCNYLLGMVDGMSKYPHEDLREKCAGRPFTGRLRTSMGDDEASALVGSADIEEGPLRYTSFDNIPPDGMTTKIDFGDAE